MAPLIRQSTSWRIPQLRPSGDLESLVPIWNGSAGETPASSSNMHFPRGDNGIEDPDDCCDDASVVYTSTFDASVDKEISPAAVMSEDPIGVTKIRDQHAKRWENDERDLFAPVPIPDSPQRRKEPSPRRAPPILPDCGEGPLELRLCNLTKPGRANTTGVAFMPDSKQVSPSFLGRPQRPPNVDVFCVQLSEGGAPIAPTPTSPDRPGTEMPGRQHWTPPSPPLSPMLASNRLITPPLMQDDAEILPMPPMPPPTPPPEPRSPPWVDTVTLEAERATLSRRSRSAGKKLRKSVSFSTLDPISYAVQPYSEVYGDHPKNFHFDPDGNKVSHMQARLLDFKQDWLEKHEGPSWDYGGGYQHGFDQRECQPFDSREYQPLY